MHIINYNKNELRVRVGEGKNKRLVEKGPNKWEYGPQGPQLKRELCTGSSSYLLLSASFFPQIKYVLSIALSENSKMEL